MQFRKILGIILAFIALSNLAFAEGVQKEINFKEGEASTTIEGGVVRGDRDEYTLSAEAGQTMSVSITSEEDNAVFQIYGEVEGSWTPLQGADEGDDATEWEGELPDGGTGRFKIVVGGTRGNATYTLEVAIK